MSAISGQSPSNLFLSGRSTGSSVSLQQVIAKDLTGPATAAKTTSILLSDSAPTATNHVGIGAESGGGLTVKTSANTYGFGSSAGAPTFSMDGTVVLSSSAVDPAGKISASRIALTKVADGTAAGAAINFGTYADGATLYSGIQKAVGGDVLVVTSDGVANSHSYQFSEGATAGIALDAQLMLNKPTADPLGRLTVDRVIASKQQTTGTALNSAILLGSFADGNTVYRGIQYTPAGDVQIMSSDGALVTNSHLYSFTEGSEPSLAVHRQLGAAKNWLGGALSGPAAAVTGAAISGAVNFVAGPTLIGTPLFIRVSNVVCIFGRFTANLNNTGVPAFDFACNQLTVLYADANQAFGAASGGGLALDTAPLNAIVTSVPAAARINISFQVAPVAAPGLAPYSFWATILDNDPS